MKVILTIIFVFYFEIIGAVLATMISYIIAAVLSSISLNNLIGRDRKLFNRNVLTVASGVIMTVIAYAVGRLIDNLLLRNLLYLFLGILIYFTLIYLFRIYSKEEIKAIPFLNKIIK
jgi:O-antigen/teichoic acid export membrane protein